MARQSSEKLEPLFNPKVLAQLELLQLKSRRSFLSAHSGEHVSPKRGHGIEFSDYGSYQLGDDPRHIDWNVYARSERLYIKRYREEQNLQIGFVLDNSSSMHVSKNNRKWEASLNLVLALGFVSIMQHDHVHFALPGKYVSGSCKNVRQINEVAQKLKKCGPSPAANLIKDLQAYVSKLRYPGMIFFISDFLYEIETFAKIVRLFLAKNVDLVCLQVLSQEERNLRMLNKSLVLKDSETGEEQNLEIDDGTCLEYDQLLSKHILSLQEISRKNNLHFISVNSADDLMTILSKEFLTRGLVRHE